MSPARRTSSAGATLAPKNRSNAGHELAGAERLGDVIVGAQLQPHQLVRLVVTGGEHDDRQSGGAPDLAGDVEPVDARQAKVQDHEVRVLGVDAHESLAPVPGTEHREAGALEVVAHDLGDLVLVVDDQNRLHRSAW